MAKKIKTESNKGQFQDGHKKKGGRTKGTPNKTTRNLRRVLEEQLSPHLDEIGTTIERIKDPAQKSAALAQWTSYLLPKYSNTTITNDTARDIATEEYISQLNQQYSAQDIHIDINTLRIVDNE